MKRIKQTLAFALYQFLDFVEAVRGEKPDPEFEKLVSSWTKKGEPVSFVAYYKHGDKQRINIPWDQLDRLENDIQHIRNEVDE